MAGEFVVCASGIRAASARPTMAAPARVIAEPVRNLRRDSMT
jgi:hypothetical protein